MFTGIVEELGRVERIEVRAEDARITIAAPLAVSDASTGDSIAVDGVCLTVVDHDAERFTADVMRETLRASTLGELRPEDQVNLERAMRVGDRLGGHIVQGHVDTTAEVVSLVEAERWTVVRFTLDAGHARRIVTKGSVAVQGVSLTVSALGTDWFEVSLIPETLTATTLGTLTPGDTVNIETDVLARHVERLLETASVTRPGDD